MSEAMSVPNPSSGRWSPKAWRTGWHDRWEATTPKTRTWIQTGVLVASVLVAYNYSLSTLLQTADQQTPLAYISLVPAIALALAAIRARSTRPEPPIHDRHVDYTIGIPLILTAVAVNQLLPTRMSAMFWIYRIDLLTLPVFVAGAVAIIFGTRVLWRQKLAIVFLFLAWPYPYQRVLLGVLNAFTAVTVIGVRHIVHWLNLAKPTGSLGNNLFVVTHHGQSFVLSVVTACSGVNGVVGFLLIGSAFAAVVKGPFVRKTLWLIGGMALLMVINLARITLIFYAGKQFGESVAINVFHPFIGLVTFSIGVVIMIMLIRPLGMHVGIAEARATVHAPPNPVPAGPVAVPSLYEATAPPAKSKVVLAVPKVYMALTVAIVAALALGISNFGLRSFNLVASVTGQAKLLSYDRFPIAPVGWVPQYQTSYDWAKPLFGDTSIWNRYILHSVGPGPVRADVPVVADVINAPDLSGFSAYGVEQCYAFHGYSLADVAQVPLSGGLTGQAMSYTSQQFGSWSILYWIVPVKQWLNVKPGQIAGTNYERIVLYVQNSGSGTKVGGLTSVKSVQNVAGNLDPTKRADRALIDNRTFLVAFAKQLIDAQGQRQVTNSVAGNTLTQRTA